LIVKPGKEVNAMQIKKTITVAVAALFVTGASLGGVALAQSSSGAGEANTGVSQAVESSAPAAGNVRGDQPVPDEAEANEAPDAETGSGSEAESTESDGPGGHEDPPGNVDHQFEGEE
jgi:hypothetical protein